MFDLKPIHEDAIPASLTLAEKYRFLNEPREAESICRDVLRADPDNQEALVVMVLSLTDQFGKNLRVAVNHTLEITPKITDEYQRIYFTGVVYERWAKAQKEHNAPGHVVYDWYRKAMGCFEQAETLSPEGNDDAILRWNTCARIIKRNDQLRPLPQDQSIEAGFEDEVPYR